MAELEVFTFRHINTNAHIHKSDQLGWFLRNGRRWSLASPYIHTCTFGLPYSCKTKGFQPVQCRLQESHMSVETTLHSETVWQTKINNSRVWEASMGIQAKRQALGKTMAYGQVWVWVRKCLLFWDRLLLSCSGWPWTFQHLPSASLWLWL